jgi:hypothetical protein
MTTFLLVRASDEAGGFMLLGVSSSKWSDIVSRNRGVPLSRPARQQTSLEKTQDGETLVSTSPVLVPLFAAS